MPLPVRQLTVLPSWDCHGCTDCCREYRVHVTSEEQVRIEAQGWDKQPGLEGVDLFVKDGRRGMRLNQTAAGACVFLDEANRCRIHGLFGSAAKPLACRLYPFVLIPCGDHWRVGLRFACPSVAEGKGRPLNVHDAELREYAAALEAQENVAGRELPLPPLQGRQAVPWSDLFLFTRAMCSLLKNREDRVERRLRKVLVLAQMCRSAKFDKVTGTRLGEFLNILGMALDGETPATAAEVPPPGWIGRILFRQMLALFARKDSGQNVGVAARGRRALFGAAVRFARGTGPVPRVHGLLPEVTFEQLEEPTGDPDPEVEQLFERYYLVKLESMQFCGPTNFHNAYWDGLESLLVTYPAICWLARAFRDKPRLEAATQALRIVDDNFGFNPLLGSSRQRFALRILSSRGELPRLIAWYAR